MISKNPEFDFESVEKLSSRKQKTYFINVSHNPIFGLVGSILLKKKSKLLYTSPQLSHPQQSRYHRSEVKIIKRDDVRVGH
jgi:hypothetical protein